MEERVYITHNVQETELLAEGLAKELWNVPALALYGGLGMGKTAFTRGLARGLDVPHQVTSPTFTIVNEYEGIRRLCHFDMYRLSSPEDLENIGWYDYLVPGTVCAVEWSENVAELLPADHLRVDIRRGDEDTLRIITLSGLPAGEGE